MKSPSRALALLGATAILVAACSGGSSTAPSESASASAAPSESAPASSAPATLTGKLVLWHSYGSSGGGAEFKAFSRILEQVKAANPGLEIEALDVPFSDIYKKIGRAHV